MHAREVNSFRAMSLTLVLLAASATADASEAPVAPPSTRASVSACNAQPPQEFLIRGNWFFNPKLAKEDRKKRAELHGEAVRYRTEHYGYFRGFGRPEWNAHPPAFYAVDTKFFGVTVKMHKAVVPALSCVEEEIRSACAATPYVPKALGGIRFKNTYHTGEITNHAYGIAIDIDPVLNPCCGCVPPWNNAPQCRRPSKTPYDRMSLPECWVHAFTKYGFYWLGYDPMKDTMHFEFLGDPTKVVRP
jgi:hypothetical protein